MNSNINGSINNVNNSIINDNGNMKSINILMCVCVVM